MSATWQGMVLRRRRDSKEQGVGGRAERTGKAFWLVGLVAISLLGAASYVMRELFVAWLAFSALFVAGSLLVIAAYVVGAAVEWTIQRTRTQLRRACGGFSSAHIQRQCLVAVGPGNQANETVRALPMGRPGSRGGQAGMELPERKSP
jgi:hypothetical protein